MHDLIHDLAESVSKDENFRMDNCKSSSLGSIINLSLNPDRLEPSGFKDICNKHNIVRTLIVPYQQKWFNINLPLDHTLTCLRSIHTLTLASCGIKELPDNINNLKYLRYLDISNNDIEELLDTICCLYNLLYLNIFQLPLKSFPTRMCNLINLRCIKSQSDYEHGNFMCAIYEVGKMTSLQFLPDFKVSYEQGRTISEVKSLRQLHGSFCLWGLEVLESRTLASEAKLNEKEFLDELALVWDSNQRNNKNDKEVIEGLQPHNNIKSLSIKSYGGSLTPSWLDQFVWLRIKKLKLSSCHKLEKVECLGQLPYLKFLDIRYMNAVKIVGLGLRCELNNLEEIHFQEMPEWENWIVPEENSFSCLRKLIVRDCPKLSAIPLLKQLEINANDMSLLPVQGLNGLTSLKEFTIVRCPNLKPMSQNKDAIYLPPSLTKLQLLECGYVEKALQDGCIQILTSLSELALWAHETKSDETRVGLFLPPSIRELHLICEPHHLCGPSIRFVHSLSSCPHQLLIYGCSGIHSLPMELLHNFTGLRDLSIWSCNELRSIEGLQVITSLKGLFIHKCPQLIQPEATVTNVAYVGVENYVEEGLSSSLMLEILLIDEPRLLKLRPLQTTLHTLRRLCIYGFEESVLLNREEERELLHSLKSLHSLHFFCCWSLQSLPSGLHMPPSLEYLQLYYCPNLQSLPVERFPPSLKFITLQHECCHPKLKEQLQKYKEDKQNKGEPLDLYLK